ncbi:13301_t:CDS:1 [Acaulospora morrowiae]|uniref:13301_t:CDS:1 n=1 Tax=Acaulospora morrowiae TaxID=94023 RepID=A0A9N9C6W0_9GLOM|nr:13301_t:CDS:1 [Acaulospora morrowiae]
MSFRNETGANSLPPSCLREIINISKGDLKTLHSCMFVNRQWCEIAVEIFWRNLWSYRYHVGFLDGAHYFWKVVLRTLISCLPNESKDFLNANGVTIPWSSYNRSPLYDYPSYCNSLDCFAVSNMIESALWEALQNDRPRRFLYIQHLMEQEICKLFISRCGTISNVTLDYIPIPYFPGAGTCFSQLSVLYCHTAVPEMLFYAMAQICKSIQKMFIEFYEDDNLGLSALVDVQQHLSYLRCKGDEIADIQSFPAIIDVIRTNSYSFVHLDIVHFLCIQPAIISTMLNLKTLKIRLDKMPHSDVWEELASVRLPKLETLQITLDSLRLESLQPLIANNSGMLSTLILDFKPKVNRSATFNETIAQFCPNLKFLVTWFLNEEFDVLEELFSKCQNLERLMLQGTNGSTLDGVRLFRLMSQVTTLKLMALGLKGGWSFSKEGLKTFFEGWKSKGNVITLFFDEKARLRADFIELIEKYFKKGVVKKYKVAPFRWNEFC